MINISKNNIKRWLTFFSLGLLSLVTYILGMYIPTLVGWFMGATVVLSAAAVLVPFASFLNSDDY